MVIWFIMEFSVRIWAAGCRSCYQGALGRLKFIRRPFCLIGESLDLPVLPTSCPLLPSHLVAPRLSLLAPLPRSLLVLRVNYCLNDIPHTVTRNF